MWNIWKEKIYVPVSLSVPVDAARASEIPDADAVAAK